MRFDCRYIDRVTPPAPMVVVRVRRPDGGKASRLPALIDTGADRTVVPADVIRRLGVGVVRMQLAAGFDGQAVELPIHRVRLRVHNMPPILVDVFAGGDECLLGRDVLNRYTLTLNGPAGLLTVTDD